MKIANSSYKLIRKQLRNIKHLHEALSFVAENASRQKVMIAGLEKCVKLASSVSQIKLVFNVTPLHSWVEFRALMRWSNLVRSNKEYGEWCRTYRNLYGIEEHVVAQKYRALFQ